MNKILVGVVVLGVVVLGGWWYTSNSNQAAMKEMSLMEEKALAEKMAMEKTALMEKNDSVREEISETMVKEDALMVKGGQYVSYDAAKVLFAKEGTVILFFRASWCPSCRALDADIKANLSQIPQDVLILDVDYDKYTDLKKQYGVTYQHTLVQVDASGTMLTKWSGSTGLSDMLKQVK